MNSAGASLLALVGLLLLVIFAAGGVFELFVPPPPSMARGIEAACICMAGIILMTVTHCIAFYLGMIAALNPSNPADLRQAKKLWSEIFRVIPTGISLLKNIAKSDN